jgi:ABC-type ATPase involved in cell division
MSQKTCLTLSAFSGDSDFKNLSVNTPINFELNQGELLCFPGGRAPSLLIKILFGLGVIKTGKATYQSPAGDLHLDSSTQGPALQVWRSLFGMVFRDYGLISNMSIFENMALPLRYHGPQSVSRPEIFFDVEERVSELLSELKVAPELFKLRPHDVSWGDRKKVLIARSLVRDPPILIMDGPTHLLSYLDYPLLAGWIEKQKKERLVLMNAENIAFGLAIADKLFDVETGTALPVDQTSPLIEDYILEQAHSLKKGILHRPNDLRSNP